MWKWILGSVLLIVVLIVWRVASMYQTFAAGGDFTSTTIAASPDRVFGALSDPDSMKIWMGTSATVASSRHGMVQVGDTVRVDEGESIKTGGTSRSTITWIVTEVTPGKVLALSMQNDSNKVVVATQRDSLIAVGDSTQVVTTIGVPMMDSIRSTRTDTSSRVGGAMLNFGSKMMIGAFRKISEMDRLKLKAHLEAKAAVAP